MDAFSISWNNHLFYAFPPFSLIVRHLQKIEMENSEGIIIIVPMRETQPWSLVLTTITHDNRCSKDSPTTLRNSTNANKAVNNSSSYHENDPDGLQSIRRFLETGPLETQGISKRASDIILQSWRQGTQKQYASYIKRWITYCHTKQVNCFDPSISQPLVKTF